MKLSFFLVAIWMVMSCGASSLELNRLASDEEEIANIDDFQIGQEFGKHPFTFADLEHVPAAMKVAHGTGYLDGGTVFFIGKFAGKLIFASNHHVCPKAKEREGVDIDLPVLKTTAVATKLLGTWPKIDTSLLVAEMKNPKEKNILLPYAQNFDFTAKLTRGQKLVTLGFGWADNPETNLMINYDDDCIVFSDGLRYLADPDKVDPAKYKSWSFANGCDISHGDSGSAALDRKTGKVVGIIWTGKMPKLPKARDSDYLQRIMEDRDEEEIWNELTYAVPSSKIGELFEKIIKYKKTPVLTKKVLSAVIKL